MNANELLKILFPEYQIHEAVKENGFIAKRKAAQTPVRQSLKRDEKVTANCQENTSGRICTGADIPYAQKANNSFQASGQKEKAAYVQQNQKQEEKVIVKSNDVFDALPDAISEYWAGSEKDRKSICKAFQRPFIHGFDNTRPKNAILLIGSESRGKVYLVRCVSMLLKQKKIFCFDDISVLNMSDYASDSGDGLFLSDLYKALNSQTESIVFDEIDKASLSQKDIIYQLLGDGTYKLNKRYMVSNGSLVDANGVLNTELVSSIPSNGKFFIFTTTSSEGKIISSLGNKFVQKIGDIIVLDSIDGSNIAILVHTLAKRFTEKCEQNLHVAVVLKEGAISKISQSYNVSNGIKGLIEYIDNKIYEPLTEMKLDTALWDGESADIDFNESGYVVALKGGEEIPLSKYLKKYDAIELEEVKNEINDVVGLKKVKEYVLGLEKNNQVQQMRAEKGFTKAAISMHMVFEGNPGTGKTTIARIVAKYLKAIGVLSSGQLVEVTRADLVGQYAGHTAAKTTEAIKSAIGGVLFIDEAYSLCRDKTDIFGLEAIDALVKGMEDNRDDLIVILAGYEDEMNAFLKTNPGLKSRFPNIIHFEDYTSEEMYEIAEITAKSKGYRISEDCREGLLDAFDKSHIKGKNDSGNGRLVRNMLEAAILSQSSRVIENHEDEIDLLIPSDFGLDKKEPFDLEARLSKIIGLNHVKDVIRNQYTLLQANQLRKKADINVNTEQSLHMIFAGNPGTGKTTMARLMGEMFKAMGVLKSGQLVETDKAGLVGTYLGQTAQKTTEVFKSALGGILFIDEAYAITAGNNSYGQECIDTLVKLIEDSRGDIIVILAGYTKEMKEFLKANSGLESRFPIFVEFPDYSADELFKIGCGMVEERGFVLTDESLKAFRNEIEDRKQLADINAGNGRMVRNLIEEMIRRQSVRIVKTAPDRSQMNIILPEDIKQDMTDTASHLNKTFDLEAELSKVIGLENVKKYIRSLNARLRVQEARKNAGLKTNDTQTLHMIFEGNPGTGKTMMARIVANVLYSMGVIHTNKMIETDRSGLVAGYVGQTAIKTRQVIESAIGGVLFIDEAYSLAQGGDNDFGKEAIDTLVKMMDDNRDRLVVILAGYQEDMDHFLSVNSGLYSRFANIIQFPDYSTEELMQIAEKMYTSQGYVLSDGAKQTLKLRFDEARRDSKFGNGRYVRNVFEKSLNNQALRLNSDSSLSKEDLITIAKEDVQEV